MILVGLCATHSLSISLIEVITDMEMFPPILVVEKYETYQLCRSWYFVGGGF